jgi:hypothetical protein
MHGAWLQDLEFLESISQDATARQVFLRMAAMSREDRLGPFLAEVAVDDELDEATKDSLAELADNRDFLHAVADYLHHTRRFH